MLKDLLALKAPAEVIESYKKEPDDFLVLVENWDAVTLFNRCQTQWLYAPGGQLLGFNYSGVEIVRKRMKLKRKNKLFTQIQVMERTTLKELEVT